MNQPPIDPVVMFRSFLTVVSGFVLSGFVPLLIALGLGYLFFPEFMAFFQLDDAEQKKQAAENIWKFVPMRMLVILVILSFIAVYLVGWLSASWSPFAPFQHGLFIAILVFAWLLQGMIAAPANRKAMDLTFMMTLPIGILLGARHASIGLASTGESTNESDE
jgi:hypothetical protein